MACCRLAIFARHGEQLQRPALARSLPSRAMRARARARGRGSNSGELTRRARRKSGPGAGRRRAETDDRIILIMGNAGPKTLYSLPFPLCRMRPGERKSRFRPFRPSDFAPRAAPPPPIWQGPPGGRARGARAPRARLANRSSEKIRRSPKIGAGAPGTGELAARRRPGSPETARQAPYAPSPVVSPSFKRARPSAAIFPAGRRARL